MAKQSEVSQLLRLARLRANREACARKQVEAAQRKLRNSERVVSIFDRKLRDWFDNDRHCEQDFMDRLAQSPLSGTALARVRSAKSARSERRDALQRDHAQALKVLAAAQHDCEQARAHHLERQRKREAIDALLVRKQRLARHRQEQLAELSAD